MAAESSSNRKLVHLSPMARAFTQFRLELLLELQRNGFENVLVSEPDPVHSSQLQELGFKLEAVEFPSSPSLAMFRAIKNSRQLIRKADCVCLHQPMALLVGVIASLGTGKRVIYFTGGLKANEGMSRGVRLATLICELILLQRVALVLSVNREDDKLLRRFSVESHYVGPRGGSGIDTTRFHPSDVNRQALRRELMIDEGRTIVGMVGRIEEEKGVFQVLDYFTQNPKLVESCCLVLVGSGSEDSRLESILEQLPDHLRGAIRFAGRQEDVERWYPAFDVFILASKREGMPTSLLEAMSSGCVAMTTDVRGAREVIRHGENGFIYDTVTDLCYDILSVAQVARSETLVKNQGRATVVAEYSSAVLTPRTFEIVSAILP